MNVNALQQALRERDEASKSEGFALDQLKAAESTLTEAVALLRRYALLHSAPPFLPCECALCLDALSLCAIASRLPSGAAPAPGHYRVREKGGAE